MRHLTIKSTASCLGSVKRDLTLDKQTFKECNPDIPASKVDHVVDHVLGRDIRFHLDPTQETALLLAKKAASQCLARAGLTGKDIDMIIFQSNIPEYFTPPTALMLHAHLGCPTHTMCYDMNANCVGMLFAYIHANAMFNYDTRIHRCLIVQSDYFTSVCRPDNLISSFAFTDNAFAMLLEEDSAHQSGLLSHKILTDTEFVDFTLAPNKGSTYLMNHFTKDNITMTMDNDIDTNPQRTLQYLKDLLSENNLEIADIKGFFFSQYVKATIDLLQAGLEIPPDKLIYIGDKFGYTGANSPFLVMQEAIKLGQVQKGDLCLFWTIGSAFQHAFVLAKI